MLLITRMTADIELLPCYEDGCEYVCMNDEREALGWGQDWSGNWRCERCYHYWADEWGVAITPRRIPRLA